MLSLALTVMMQDLPPPAPKNIPPPPVGDVPIDGYLGILLTVAVIIAFFVLRKRILEKSL